MDLLVKAGEIIDGTGADPIKKGAILINGNTIKEVGRQSELKAESGTRILDAGDRTIVPGLIDCHAHVCSDYHKWTHENYVPREVAKTTLLGVYNARLCVRAGVLTVRDAGCGQTGIFQLRSAITSGRILGPRLLVSGQPIAMTGGHAWDMAREVDGPDETRKAVRDMLRWGADCIKFMVTGGAATHYEEMDQTQLTLSELSAGVEEAKKKNKRTLAHANCSSGALLCVEAGVDSIDHGNMLDNKALDAMKNAGAFYVPTLYAYVGAATRGSEAGFSEWTIEKCKKTLEAHRESFQRAYEMGVNIATGTDLGMGKQASSYGKLGESMITELELMVKYGMTPMHAIKCATHMSARNLGIEKSVGTLERGKLADLVIIDGDPLENTSNLRRVWRVMKEGEIVHET